MDRPLEDKNIMITGAKSGIGLAAVTKLAENGANIWACMRQENPQAQEIFKKLEASHQVAVKPIYFDVTSESQIKEALVAVMKEKKTIDGLVNAAGIAHGGLFQMTPVSKIREVFDVNFFSALEITQRVIRAMVKQKSGSIVNLASISGLDLKAGNCAYGVSKAALSAWTCTLAAEVGSLGIRVNAVAPGLINTRMAQQMEAKAGEEMRKNSAMERLGTAEEVADVIAFLISDRSSFINGQTIRVDGGRK